MKQGRDTVQKELLQHLMQYNAVPSVANGESLLPFHVACKNGCTRCLQCLTEQNKDLAQALTAKQETGLHLACTGGHQEVAQFMLQVFPGCIDMADVEGNTPLHKCALVGSLECAVVLLKAGANTALKNNA